MDSTHYSAEILAETSLTLPMNSFYHTELKLHVILKLNLAGLQQSLHTILIGSTITKMLPSFVKEIFSTTNQVFNSCFTILLQLFFLYCDLQRGISLLLETIW